MKKEILVTGGAGFIGSHLVEKLINNKKVSKVVIIDNFLDGTKKNLKNVLNHRKIKIIKLDLLDLNKKNKSFKKIDTVVHLAALSDVVPSIDKPKKYIINNFVGTLNVLELMRINGIKRIIYTASSSCYGDRPKIPTSEKDIINCKYPYSYSKYISETLIKHYSDLYKLEYISLRLFNVYGTRSRTTGAYGAVFGIFLKQKLEGKPFTVVGNGKQRRDFIFVSDVVSAVEKAIFLKKKNLIFNIGANKPFSINQLVKILGGKKIFVRDRPGEPRKTNANINFAKKTLNWKPKILFEDGINIMIKNINDWKKTDLWDKKSISKATKNWFKYLA